MTGVAYRVEYDDAQVRAAIGGLRDFGDERIRAAWSAIGGAMVSSTQLRFYNQHGPDNSPWVQSQRARTTGTKTLIWHAFLFNSITFNVLGVDGLEWGSPLVYAGMMQTGGVIHVYARGQDIYRKVGRDGTINPKFVKKSQSNFASHVEIGEHDIGLIGWPYLGIDSTDGTEIENTFARHIGAAMLGISVGAFAAHA